LAVAGDAFGGCADARDQPETELLEHHTHRDQDFPRSMRVPSRPIHLRQLLIRPRNKLFLPLQPYQPILPPYRTLIRELLILKPIQKKHAPLRPALLIVHQLGYHYMFQNKLVLKDPPPQIQLSTDLRTRQPHCPLRHKPPGQEHASAGFNVPGVECCTTGIPKCSTRTVEFATDLHTR